MPLALADRNRLAACLELLHSPHQGEVLAAAAAADRLIRARGLDWRTVLAAGVAPSPAPATPPPDGPTDWRLDLRTCDAHGERLTEWERPFVRNLRSRRKLTPRQVEVLAGIACRLRARGGVGG